MVSHSESPEVILYHYTYSPYAKRVAWYLTLRGIPYSQCVREDPDCLAAEGLTYHRSFNLP